MSLTMGAIIVGSVGIVSYIISRLVRGFIRGVVLFLLVLSVLLMAGLVTAKYTPYVAPIRAENGELQFSENGKSYTVKINDVVAVEALKLENDKILISGAAGGHLFKAEVNKYIYQFFLKKDFEKELKNKFVNKVPKSMR